MSDELHVTSALKSKKGPKGERPLDLFSSVFLSLEEYISKKARDSVDQSEHSCA